MNYYVAGDIGGTNSRFSLYGVQRSEIHSLVNGEMTPGQLVLRKTYENENYSSFLAVLNEFIAEASTVGGEIDCACFAVAGPVKRNRTSLTNKSAWVIDGNELAVAAKIKIVTVINDFVGAGYGVLTLNEQTDCVCLQQAEKLEGAPIACIGPGTGLGECFITPYHVPVMNSSYKGTTNYAHADGFSGKSNALMNADYHISYHCFPSEGGHVEFAPKSPIESELLAYLTTLFPARVSVERVVSGAGIAHTYDFFALKYPELVDITLQAQMNENVSKKPKIIATNRHTNELCKLTMDMFANMYGAEAGNCALKFMPFGGLYLTGGITPKNIELITAVDGPFMQSFWAKGRVSAFLKSIPIYAVTTADVGERGAMFVAYRSLLTLHDIVSSC